MYKLLLCLRYLRTRYIALASIISVMLGVATMIVVNSVMSGFQSEMYKRLHGILSDVVVEAQSMEGIQDPKILEAEIQEVLGDDIAGMTSTVQVPSMMSFQYRGEWITRQLNVIGIDDETYAQVSDFSRFLLHPSNRERLTFDLPEDGYDDRLRGGAGWIYRRIRAAQEKFYREQMERIESHKAALSEQSPTTVQLANHTDELPFSTEPEHDPFAGVAIEDDDQHAFDPATETHTGIVLGIATCSIRTRDQHGEPIDVFLCRPGDDVKVTLPTAGTPPKAVHKNFTVVDLYESKMSEYDSSLAFVPISALQNLRGMINPQTGVATVSSIQIKLRDGADLNAARDKLRERFPADLFPYRIQTWKELQGPLLAAVQMETTILNILLFLIIAVAGFGILATFFMIVVEKTRDIGILKSLGATRPGVMSIFLGYGFSLGCVGSGVGMVLGLLFVANINRIAAWLESITGREVFDPTIYYFQEIPTIVTAGTVSWIVGGAMLIAVLASVLPAVRAARMHPVEALRYE